MSRLEIDGAGRLISPDGAFSITYNDPWPSPNGNWGFSEPAFGVCEHTEVGYEHNVIDEFNNPGAQASSFCSNSGGYSPGIPDGHIHQYGPIGKGWMAWTQANGNPHWRGVENEDGGDPSRPLTTLQLCSLAAIVEVCSRHDGFPIQATDDPDNGRGLIFHSDGGAAWGGHDCPGDVRRAQRPTVLWLAGLCRGGSLPPPLIKEGDMIARNTHGKGYWAVRKTGAVYAFDGAPAIGPSQRFLTAWGIGTDANPIVGITDDGAGGFVLSADANDYPGTPHLYGITADGAYRV